MPRSLGFSPSFLLEIANRRKQKQRVLSPRSLNVRGCGADQKKWDIIYILKERKLVIMALSEIKVKGKGEQMQ